MTTTSRGHTTAHAHVRRLAFRFDETSFYLTRGTGTDGSDRHADAAYGHARALWALALRVPVRDLPDVLALTAKGTS